MISTTLSQIADFAGTTLTGKNNLKKITRISTDSRTLQRGDLFVAIRGENFDGHSFVGKAAERGAIGAVIDQNWSGNTPPAFALIRVDDPLVAYQQIAARYRASLSLK